MPSYRSRTAPHLLLATLWLSVALAAPIGAESAAVPDEGDCPTVSGRAAIDEHGIARDVAAVTLKEGMELGIEDLLILRSLVPAEIWAHREVFFFEGMRMEIGPCHRRYTAPSFLKTATESFSKAVELDTKGNLKNYTAGTPFPPDNIDLEAKDAAVRWAWNLQQRFRGGGHRGHFKVVDFPNRYGLAQTFEGTFYLMPTTGRADLPETNYSVPNADTRAWVAGGHFTKPFSTRHIAWRQFRPLETQTNFSKSDDTFIYVPSMRKSRRASTSWVDGVYFPTYTVAGQDGGGPLSFGEMGGTINPSGGRSAAVTVNAYRGFEGISVRPNAYVWRMKGSVDVLAPINGTVPGYPQNNDRNFGPAGLSVASDRWDVRHAIVIEGAIRPVEEAIRTVTYYIDAQTMTPLYRMTRTGKRRLLDIQIFVHRFSGDIAGYPEWPGGMPADVFDPVAQVSYNAIQGGGGWRRESYDIVSLPFSEDDLPGLISAAALERGH